MNEVNSLPQGFVAELRQQALAAGFEACGIVSADKAPDLTKRLRKFTDNGWHGEMDWFAARLHERAHAAHLWPGVHSIVMLGMNYGPGFDPLPALRDKSRGVISVYARGKDYHGIINKRLKRVAGWLQQKAGGEVKVFVDTAPVAEKPLAQAAGIGWQGKHTNLVSRSFGSWLFLGAIYATAALPDTLSTDDHCGACRLCLDICPTQAFPAPRQLDARRCISYLTIEYKGHIAPDMRAQMGNRIFGCDDCLAVCPWNKFAQTASETRFHAREPCDNPPLAELLVLNDAGFRARFAGTPIKRAGRDGFVRNTLIAAGNTGDKALVPLIRPLLRDEAAIVRAMAVWALNKLLDEETFAAVKNKGVPGETDPDVLREWEQFNE